MHGTLHSLRAKYQLENKMNYWVKIFNELLRTREEEEEENVKK
jgi:hypothetical protein